MTDARSLSQSIFAFTLMLVLVPAARPQEVASAVIPTSPVHADAGVPDQESLGDIYMARHEYVRAINAYQTYPNKTAKQWNKVGVAYHHMFALEEARKSYVMAIRLLPRYPEALNNLAAVYHAKRDFSRAEKTYRQAIKYQPQSAVIYGNLGTTYFAERKYKQGVKAYQKALGMDPKIFDADRSSSIEEESSREQRVAVSYSLAKVYASAGRQQEALEALRKAILAGFKDRKHLMEDKEFASLRQMAEFKQLLVQEHLD